MQQFKCGNPKCAYAIAAEGLNRIQLKALRMWAKTCPRCGKQTHWIEQQSLPEITNITNIVEPNGGAGYDKSTTKDLPKSASQKRRAARYDGLH